MDLIICAGKTIVLPNSINGKGHLQIILTNPSGNPEEVLMVNLSSKTISTSTSYEDNDLACIVNPGEHPFVKHETYVRYGKAVIAKVRDIQSLIELKKYQFHYDCNDALLDKILSGLWESNHANSKIIEFAKRNIN
jgi:hypothetical protein